MNNFCGYQTPEEAFKQHIAVNDPPIHTLEDYKRFAKNNALCEICKVEKVWKMVDTDMCFSCTTGEADASEDYELLQED